MFTQPSICQWEVVSLENLIVHVNVPPPPYPNSMIVHTGLCLHCFLSQWL